MYKHGVSIVGVCAWQHLHGLNVNHIIFYMFAISWCLCVSIFMVFMPALPGRLTAVYVEHRVRGRVHSTWTLLVRWFPKSVDCMVRNKEL